MGAIPILLSGLPGNMAREVALLALDAEFHRRFRLLDLALTGADITEDTLELEDQAIRLLRPADRGRLEVPTGTIAIDFTAPGAALANAAFFIEKGLPFVMGTTGFSREEAAVRVSTSPISAVIAPNMAIPIILVQAAARYLADRFPGAMTGYQFGIMESHQQGKKDTSGTAKALVRDFAALGLPASVDQIKMIREPGVQRQELSVPAEHVNGHAYHFYEIATKSGDVRVELSHRVHGRRVYAHGALVAAEFLQARIEAGSRGEVFDMIDVLEHAHPAG
ncbi:dihydrodipicolinate reductase [Candidatus Poribacteria bacterium]|nr:dihydrodipicolinate reductase [Candidatus Poribacteria bacterium]